MKRRNFLQALIGSVAALFVGNNKAEATDNPTMHLPVQQLKDWDKFKFEWEEISGKPTFYSNELRLYLNGHFVYYIDNLCLHDKHSLEEAKIVVQQEVYWSQRLFKIRYGYYPKWFFDKTGETVTTASPVPES